MNVVIRKQILDDERLAIIFCEVESVLNSRPFVRLSNDPADLKPITTNHGVLLTGPCVQPTDAP